MGRSFADKEIKILFARSGNVCAFPGCEKALVEPGTDVDDPVVLAEICHIVADSRQGPRGDSDMSDADRDKHPNLILLCDVHHKVIDRQPRTYSVAVLKQMKADHEAGIAQSTSRQEAGNKPKFDFTSETLHSTLLPLSHLPRFVYAAPARFTNEQFPEAVDQIARPNDRKQLTPFLLRDGDVLAFQDLKKQENPFAPLRSEGSVRKLPASDLLADPEGKRRYVALLNAGLRQYLSKRGVRFDKNHFRFYFPAIVPGEPRSVKYDSINGRRGTRKVVWEPKSKKTGLGRGYWWHIAAGFRFHEMAADQWCLSIRPERHVTRDGELPLASDQIGRKVTRIKAKMYNDIYLAQVDFWRNYLSDGEARFSLDFGDQNALIEARFVTLGVDWPGIPGDDKPFKNQVYEENLFTLADLDAALRVEEGDETYEDLDDEEDEDDEEDF